MFLHPYEKKEPEVIASREDPDDPDNVTTGPVCAVCGCLDDDPQHAL